MTKPPTRVFLSYAQDSAERIDAVRQLVKALRKAGQAVDVDQDFGVGGPDESWTTWCEAMAAETERVLLVTSKSYYDCWLGRFPPGTRDGATYEAKILANRVYQGGSRIEFLRVVWFDDEDRTHIPPRLRGMQDYHGTRDLDALISWLANGHEPKRSAAANRAISKPTENPFVVNRAVTPPHFVGRELEIREFERYLSSGGGISLVGDARIGKSSLLLAWLSHAETQSHPVVLVDTQKLDGFSWPTIVSAFTAGACSPKNDQCGSADEAANWVGGWVDQQSRKPVVLIDEAEALVRELEVRFFERLRGMLDRFCLVLATRADLPSLFHKHHDTTSPLGNQCITVQLGALKESEAQDLAERAGEHSGWLRYWAGAHPYFLQLLGDCWFVSADEFAALQKLRATARDRLREQWNRLTPGQQRRLRDAAAGSRTQSRSLSDRGLMTEGGAPFGEVLRWWILEELADD